MDSTDHSRWFHPSMYLYSDSGPSPMINNSGLSSQAYSTAGGPTDGSEHYYNHGPPAPPSLNALPPSGAHDLARSLSAAAAAAAGGGHGSFLCHPMSPHSPPSSSTTNNTGSNGDITSCPSRLYLPSPSANSSSCHRSIISSQGVYSSSSSNVSPYNQSVVGNMWPPPSHMGGSGGPGGPGSFSLPQFSSNHTHHGHKESSLLPHPISAAMDNSPLYNDEMSVVSKMKLHQVGLQNYPAFPPHLYGPQYGTAGDYSSVSSTAFDMLAGFQKCRPISRSNSGKFCLIPFLDCLYLGSSFSFCLDRYLLL